MAANDVLEAKVDALTNAVNRLLEAHQKDHDTIVQLVERVETACVEISHLRSGQRSDNSVAWDRTWQIATIIISCVTGALGGAFLWIIKTGRITE